jgi:purine-binding chemotaxis protein CheW
MDAVRTAATVMDGAAVDLLLFTLDGRSFAVRLALVERVVAMVAVAPLPGAPAVVTGVIDLGGRFLPVLDVRARLGMPARAPRLTDGLVILHLASGAVALWVDHVDATLRLPAAALHPVAPLTGPGGWFDAVTALPDGPLFIHDADRFLSLDEAAALASALAREPSAS